MNVIEAFSQAKSGDDHRNEDLVRVTGDYAFVVDGATDKSGLRFAGEHGGRVAARIIGDAILSLDPESSAEACIEDCTAALRQFIAEAGLEIGYEDGPSAVLAVYSRQRREVWRVGDIAVRVGSRTRYARKAIDSAAAGVRSAYLQAQCFRGGEAARWPDRGRELILPLLRTQYHFRNLSTRSKWAFGALDGTPVPERFIDVIPVSPGSTVILASDGYPSVRSSLVASEEYLRSDLMRDPMRIWNHPATKGVRPGHESYDDRAWLRLLAE